MKQNLPTETAQPAIKRKRRGSPQQENMGRLQPCDTTGADAPPPAPLPCPAQAPGPDVPASSGETEGREERRTAATDYLHSFLLAWLALALLVTGCAGSRPLKGGKAVTTRKPAGVVEQTLDQGENPAQATKQTQETVKVRTYTVPAGSRVEQSSASAFHDPQHERNDLLSLSLSPSKGERVPKAGEGARQPSTLNSLPRQSQATAGQPSTLRSVATEDGATSFTLSAPMPVVEREETRARTELGAAQKDTARELGAKLSSLKGIVWVGVGLFVFGLASLVWPPLKAIIASVTTSAALMLGGVALMVLPSLIVGNELLILGVVVLAVGAWFLAHRHGHLQGIVAASSGAPGGRASSRAQTSLRQGPRGRSPSRAKPPQPAPDHSPRITYLAP